MTFKVGDKVRLDSDGQPVLTVTDTGKMFQGDGYFIFKDDRGRWHRDGDHFSLVPPEKPKYRLHRDKDNGTECVEVDVATTVTMRVWYGPREAAKTVEEAEEMARAAMAAIGLQEAK